MGDMRNVYRIFVGQPGGKSRHGRPTRRWEDNIETHLKEIVGKGVDGFMWLRIGTGGELLSTQ
jgi:hypothetical protein